MAKLLPFAVEAKRARRSQSWTCLCPRRHRQAWSGLSLIATGAEGPGERIPVLRFPRNRPSADEVVMTARLYHREHSFGGNTMFEASQVFDHYEQELFTASVAAAEKEGRPISLLVVPASDVFEALIVTAPRLESTRIVFGLANQATPGHPAKLNWRDL